MGVQAFPGDVNETVLDRMSDSGVSWVRFLVPWGYIETADTSPPTYDWNVIDPVIAGLASRGFTLVGVVYQNPTWAATTDCGPIDKVPLERYRTFLGALAERYDGDLYRDAPRSPRVFHWEIYNEPDFNPDRSGGLDDYGGCFGNNAAAYGQQLREAYLGAHGASSAAQVVFGGVAYDRFYNKSGYSPSGPFNFTFVRDVLGWLTANHGGEASWPFFDVMGLHLYNDYRNNWDGAAPYEQELLGKVVRFRNNELYRLGVYDLRGRPLAVTEASLPSMPSDTYTIRSEAIQAAYPGQLRIRALAAGLRNLTWFVVEDYSSGPCNEPWTWLTFGLLRSKAVYDAARACSPNPLPDYQVDAPHEAKPSLTAFRTAVNALLGWTYETQLDSGKTGSTQIEAHRFQRSGGRYKVAVFTDNGERLGRRGYPPVERQMTFDASILPDWTGDLKVTDHLGVVTHYSGVSVVLVVTQWPQYVEAD